MKVTFNYQQDPETGWWTVTCPQKNLVTQGKTFEVAHARIGRLFRDTCEPKSSRVTSHQLELLREIQLVELDEQSSWTETMTHEFRTVNALVKKGLMEAHLNADLEPHEVRLTQKGRRYLEGK